MSKIKTLIIFLFLVATSCCDRYAGKYVCDCKQLSQVQAFIERNIKPANNMSDEEMEDVIHQLWVTGVKTTCQQKILPINSHGYIDWELVELDSCQTAYSYVY